MSKQSLLLVDGDTRSLRVLEVSLRKAGFTVTAASSVKDAVDKLELGAPDLIISETTFADGDGFELRRRVRATADWSEIPFVFLTGEAAIENKIRGLELGVDDYLTKPIYIKEIVTRINILLQKKQRIRFEERKDGRTRFTGRVADMPVVDVIQTIEISRKSGVIQFVDERGRQAAIYFREGKVIDAEAGALQGEDAVYRLLTWSEGEFEVVFRTVRRRDVISVSSQGLLMEGMRRLDEWSRLLEQLPPLAHRFEIDPGELASRLADIPDEHNAILRQIDGKRTLLEVIDASTFGDLECLQAIARLYFEEILLDLDFGKPTKRDTGKPMPLIEVEHDFTTPFAGDVSSPEIQAPPPADTQPVVESAVLSERPVDEEPPRDVVQIRSRDPEPEALLGGFRPSSLRLIDEAVAAAQAIEPVAFEDVSSVPPVVASDVPSLVPSAAPAQPPVVERPPVPPAPDVEVPAPRIPADDADDAVASRPDALAEPHGYDVINGHGPAGVPETIHDDPTPTPVIVIRPPVFPNLPSQHRDEVSGLRMIGSLGRDRAEASGELVPAGTRKAPVSETQRELVTILPRRATRDIQAVSAPIPDGPSSVTVEPSLEPPPLSSVPVEVDAPQEADYEPAPDFPSSSWEYESNGTRTAARAPIGLFVVVTLAALAVAAVVLFALSKRRPKAGAASPGQGSGSEVLELGPDIVTRADASTAGAPLDAGTALATPGVDAAVARPDAAALPGADLPPPKRARVLSDEATKLIKKKEPARALELAEASIAAHRTARGYMARAMALSKLGRARDAVAATYDAEKLAPELPAVFELRGDLLWSMKRWDEAYDAYNSFLGLEEDTPRAERIRRRLEEQK